MGRLDNKVAIVTGSGRGIGKRTASVLAEEGASIVINDIDLKEANEAAEEIKKKGSEVIVVAGIDEGDVTQEENCLKMVEKAKEKLGGLHILVNNAGVTEDKTIHKMDDKMWNAVIDVNLKGTFLMIKAVSEHFKKQRYGKIVNISSVGGLGSNIGQINYAASKAAVISLTKSVARELAPYNVCINVLAPGIIDTRLTRAMPDEKLKFVTDAIPMGFGKPVDVARTILGLCSSDFDYVTGQLINVSGGLII
ncbi:MAG: glucose 1-dehydrogenase [Candidatus Bathyarchaeota archaeon]|nr:glucose 1-dehydrogenase [Candidatus Bathyarchaeota archaeon]